jgi:hypothetical protein
MTGPRFSSTLFGSNGARLVALKLDEMVLVVIVYR